MTFQIKPCGEENIVLSLSYDDTRKCVTEVRALAELLRKNRNPSIRSVRPALDSLLIECSPDPSFESWLENLKQNAVVPAETPQFHRTIEVPICYDFGYDLQAVSERTGIRPEKIIELHCASEYEVWMMGFMPGFPYMGELPAELHLERKQNPDLAVPAGSVAIAEEYVGIYPSQSPGGWNVIGRTPLQLIDFNREVPWTFDYGMKVRFKPISQTEFESFLR